MAEYLHGAYGQIQTLATRVAVKCLNAIVYVGTAPVHTVAGGSANVNRPILVNNIAEARKYFGYSEEWDKYTLCEAMHAHLESKGVGPLVLINVLDPEVHKDAESGTVSQAPVNGKVTIANAEEIILDTVAVTGKTKGTDYSVTYDHAKKMLTISETNLGSLGEEAVVVTYSKIDAAAVTADAVIGASDGMGLNTGIHAIQNVYQATGFVPAYLLAPGFSSVPAVHKAMINNSEKVNSHWDVYVMADLPIVDESGTSITLETAAAWKNRNGYNATNETVYFPLAKGTDGNVYHLSVLAAANFQQLLVEQDGIPYKTASNTECAISNLFLGEGTAARVYDDYLINKYLNKNGIASATYIGGRWVIWGCHSANYNADDDSQIEVAETNRMMLFYLCNDFQHRRTRDVDKPLTSNDIKTIVAEEQTRLDALVKIGALTYGSVHLSAEADAYSDMMKGDYKFVFNVTTTPLAKSLTALVNWTDAGISVFFTDAE